MQGLSNHSKTKRIADRLGLPVQGDCAHSIQHHALSRVEDFVEELPVQSLKGLMLLVADRLSVQIERVHSDEDLRSTISKYRDCSRVFPRLIQKEFLNSETEGLLLNNPCRRQSGERQYLALIDARGSRQYRAYFTIWHELAHLLLMPARGLDKGTQFRRAPTEEQKRTDPEEQLADRIAGHLAFYKPFFRPLLKKAISENGALNFKAIARASERAIPGASLFSAARASIRLATGPACLVEVAYGLKKRNQRRRTKAHRDLFGYEPKKQLRLRQCIRNQLARESGLEVRRNMRVPAASVLAKVQTDVVGTEQYFETEENQDWWETSRGGSLSPLSLRVCAARRGSYTYGLIFPQAW